MLECNVSKRSEDLCSVHDIRNLQKEFTSEVWDEEAVEVSHPLPKGKAEEGPL